MAHCITPIILQDNSNTNQTSTSSNASTVIEQNAVSQRRSRSPKRSLMQGQHHQPLNSNAANASASATLHHGNQGGVEFRAPLMIEQARHVNPKTPCQIVTFRSRVFPFIFLLFDYISFFRF